MRGSLLDSVAMVGHIIKRSEVRDGVHYLQSDVVQRCERVPKNLRYRDK